MLYESCQTNDYNPTVVSAAYDRVVGSNNSMPPNIPVFRFNKQKTTFSNDYQVVVKKWADSFNQLKKAQQKSNYNAEVVLPSDDTVSNITLWINEAFAIAPDLDAPDVVPDAEGGLDIEWDLENQFVSIHIDHSDKILNRIFVKTKSGYRSESLTKKNLKVVLTA